MQGWQRARRLAGSEAPEVAGRTLDGRPFALSKLRGKVVVLDLWATNCGYCSEEMADLEPLRVEFGSKVEMVSVNEEDPELAKRWLSDRKRTMPVVSVAPDTAFKAYAVESWPTVVVIDRDGRVVRQWVEFVSGAKVRRVIESLTAR